MVTPCLHVCKIDTEIGRCSGCHRTLHEIKQWSSMSEQEQIAYMQCVIPKRRMAHEARLLDKVREPSDT